MPSALERRRGALRIDDVVVRYSAAAGSVQAVDNCSIDIAPGQICVVVGPSGCGKTSLLKAIAGFHRISGGSIHLDGEMLCGPGRPQARVGSDRVVVFQNGALFPWMTNLDNVAFGPVVQGAAAQAEAREKACRLMEEAGLAGYERRYPAETSSGVRRRVEIVRALMTDPAVLLLDEPYRALDTLTKSVMHRALLDLHARRQVTIFFITHDLQEAVFLGSRVVVMTSRPCRPKLQVEVNLPYPREPSLVGARRFRELVAEVGAAIDRETRRAFAVGEREG